MCRHLAYLGPPRRVRELLDEGENSLVRQSYAPTDMRGGGVINADGYGAAWWGRGSEGPPEADAPRLHRYRSARPIWGDAPGFSALDAAVSGAVLAATRSATIGMPYGEAACAPFVDERWAFSHNGVIRGWPDAAVALAQELPLRDLLTLDATTDSALLWAVLRQRLAPGADPAQAVAQLALDAAAAAPGSRLNLLVCDGAQIIATTWQHSLSIRHDGGRVLVASEPLDGSPGWQPVPDQHLVHATLDSLTVTPLATSRRLEPL
jgi:glutamine amidotransferase